MRRDALLVTVSDDAEDAAGRLLVDDSDDNSNDDGDNDYDGEECLHSWCSNNRNKKKEASK